MALIGFDFETKSELDLITCGSMKYLKGRDADIVCMSYCIDEEPVQLWTPGHLIDTRFANPSDHTWYAFNAQFDYRVWNLIGKRYGFGRLLLDNLIDVMAICGRFTFPQKLEKVGAVLNLKQQKDKRGKALMKKICSPPYDYTHTELFDFYDYCIQDTETMRELLKALPASQLTEQEQAIWKLTAKINNRGLPIDIKAVKQVYRLTETYKEEMSQQLPGLSDGAITKVTQTKRIVTWLKKKGVKLANLQAGTVERLLRRTDLSPDARTMLELRQELGKSSTAKYLKLIEQCLQGVVYDNLRYYGTNTGRWAGMGFQLHNLPRSKVKDAAAIIAKFLDLSIINENPVHAAKDIIRGMICAPDGYMLCFADFHAVENIGLAWCAGDEATLELHRQGKDQYVDMASYVYKCHYDNVTPDQRQFGKMLILGCGYGLGAAGFRTNSDNWGVYLNNSVAKELVDAYRKKYSMVVDFWYDCKRAAMSAIRNPNREFVVKKHIFKTVKDRTGRVWLQLTLRSKRNLYYCDPSIGEGKFGLEVKAMGINPYSKQWMRLSVIPGRFVENIVQATTRDILAHAKLNLDKAGYHLIGSIHDEPISLVKDDEDCLEDYIKVMCKNPDWALDFPLTGEGVIEKRYRKM